jgi:hypothetical protein
MARIAENIIRVVTTFPDQATFEEQFLARLIDSSDAAAFDMTRVSGREWVRNGILIEQGFVDEQGRRHPLGKKMTVTFVNHVLVENEAEGTVA